MARRQRTARNAPRPIRGRRDGFDGWSDEVENRARRKLRRQERLDALIDEDHLEPA